MNETVKTKLYTFDEMKDVVMETIAKMTEESLHDKDFDNPAEVVLLESAVGGKILAYLTKRHEEGEI